MRIDEIGWIFSRLILPSRPPNSRGVPQAPPPPWCAIMPRFRGGEVATVILKWQPKYRSPVFHIVPRYRVSHQNSTSTRPSAACAVKVSPRFILAARAIFLRRLRQYLLRFCVQDSSVLEWPFPSCHLNQNKTLLLLRRLLFSCLRMSLASLSKDKGEADNFHRVRFKRQWQPSRKLPESWGSKGDQNDKSQTCDKHLEQQASPECERVSDRGNCPSDSIRRSSSALL